MHLKSVEKLLTLNVAVLVLNRWIRSGHAWSGRGVTQKYGQARFFNLWGDFDKIRKHCLKDVNAGVRAWTMCLTMFALFLRRRDVGFLRIDGLMLDIPAIWEFFCRNGTTQDSGTLFQLMRDYIARTLCPGVALLDYINLTGIKYGTIFNQFIKGSFRQSHLPMNPSDVSQVLSKVHCLWHFLTF